VSGSVRPAGPALATAIGVATKFADAKARLAFGRYELAFGGIVLGALALRLPDLTGKPFHHDESEHAWFAWLLVSGDGYRYDPVFHGPLQFYVMSLLYLLIGAGDLAARLAPALVGTMLVALPYFLRRRIGATAALSAALLFSISPSYLYFSRFVREDIYVACLTLALVAVVFRFVAEPRPWHPALIFALIAASFATKESTYITVFIWTLFFGAVVAWELGTGRGSRNGSVIVAIRSVGRDAWVWAAASFLTVFTLLFTTFFTNPQGLQDGFSKSISYWLSQQPVNRGNQPWFYYLIVIPAYEWPILAFAAIGIVSVIRRPSLIGCFLIWTFAVSLVIYSWASERMPWLVIHPLLPAVLLAGIGLQAAWRSRQRVLGKAGLVLGLAGAAYSLQAAVALAYVRPADPRELLVYTQTAPDTTRITNRIFDLERKVEARRHRHLSIEVDRWGGTGWPWGWYLRNLYVGYPDMSSPSFVPTADVVLVADPNHQAVAPRLERYTGERFKLRVWWVPDWGGASTSDWARWLVFRRAWSPRASMDEWLYVRRGLASGRA
jgi:uncharacterized protein (TIGR03663 family)